MDKVIRCHCGFEAHGEHEDELVLEVQRHASTAHGMALSHDEALLVAFRAELDPNDPGLRPLSGNRPRALDDVMSDLKEAE